MQSSRSPKHRRVRISPWLCFVSILVIGYGSLSPFSNWGDQGVSWWEWWFAPMPQYITKIDIVANIIGYLPLGAAASALLIGRSKRHVQVIVGSFVGSGISAIAESLQSFIPGRIPTLVDWYANTAGAFLGALIFVGGLSLIPKKWWLPIKEIYYVNTGLGLVIALLWLLGLIFPQQIPFAPGPWLQDLFIGPESGNSELHIVIEKLFPFYQYLSDNDALGVGSKSRLIVEGAISLATLTSYGLIITAVFTDRHRQIFYFCFLSTVAYTIRLIGEYIWPGVSLESWLPSANAIFDRNWPILITSWILVEILSTVSLGFRLTVAIFLLLAVGIAVNIIPPQPYYFQAISTISAAGSGRIAHLFGGLHDLWPYMALLLCFWLGLERSVQTRN